MKFKTLAMLTAAGLATSAYGQGVLLQNIGTGAVGATSNGAVYNANNTKFDGVNFNLGVTVLGGSVGGSLSPIGTFTQANDPKGYTGLDLGTFQLGAAGAEWLVPNVAAGGPAVIELQMWFNGGSTSLYNSYAAAVAGNDPVADVTFQNAVSNLPLTPDQPLSGMPSVRLVPVPEPTTVALAGLGLASLLIFRRRS